MGMNLLAKVGINLPPLPSAPPTHDPQRSTLIQMAAVIGLAVLMHFQIANKFIALFAALIYLLKVGLIAKRKTAPNRIVMTVLAISSLVLIIALYGGWNGQRAGISFLVLLATLKFLESRGLRDYFVVCLILYFLAASTFLFNSSILSIGTIVCYTLVITSLLYQLSNPTPAPWPKVYKASIALVAKALPLAILLFFFFPRIQGDFGFLPSQDRFNDDLELSDRLVPGEMAASAFNEELAFRVDFDGAIPATKHLYWRAKVMATEDNFHWEVISPRLEPESRSDSLRDKISLENGAIKYRVLHEQSSDFFIPYLDYVAGVERGKVRYDYSVYQAKISNSSFRYRGTSNLAPIDVVESDAFLDTLTQTGSKPTAKIQALLAQFRNSASSDSELAILVYEHFQTQPFSYSLAPDELDEQNPLDDFLFTTQIGYCEHFASAYTTLMRWLGVPARVVAGYQGGRSINNGKFLEVRYSDAHAWSEVWLNDRWQRVDPTAAISPERIEFGMDALRQLWDSGALGSNTSGRALANYLNPGSAKRVLRILRDSWSEVTYKWNKWVVDYDFDKQKELLSNLGLDSKNTAYTLIIIMFTGVGALLLFYFWQLIPRRLSRSELQSTYLKFTRQFSKRAVTKNSDESPREFSRRALKAAPQHADIIGEITHEYERLRYGREQGDAQQRLKQFKQMVKRFKLQKN